MAKELYCVGDYCPLGQGDIIWTDLNPVKGHEQANYRPYVVVSKELFNQYGLVMILPVTHNGKGVFKYRTNCFNDESYVICNQIKTIDIKARTYEYDDESYLTKKELEQVLGRFKPIIF